MATASVPTISGVSLEEYDRTSYDPDVEYLDGELWERPVVQTRHGLLQLVLGGWFRDRKKAWNIIAGVEIRTRVAPARVRLPDVVVLTRGNRYRSSFTRRQLR